MFETPHTLLSYREALARVRTLSLRQKMGPLDYLGSDRVKPTPRTKRGINGTDCHHGTYARGNHLVIPHQQWCLVSIWPVSDPAVKSRPEDPCLEIPFDTNWISLRFSQGRAGTKACTPVFYAEGDPRKQEVGVGGVTQGERDRKQGSCGWQYWFPGCTVTDVFLCIFTVLIAS